MQLRNAFLWSFIEKACIQLIQVIIFIALSRLLSPTEFGVIGFLSILIAIISPILDFGFSASLIQTPIVTETSWSTAFWISTSLGLFAGFFLFAFSHPISRWFGIVDAVGLFQLGAIQILLTAILVVPSTILIKEQRFSLLSKISILQMFIYGISGTLLAYLGMSTLSLVAAQIISQISFLVLFASKHMWRPKLKFSLPFVWGTIRFTGSISGLTFINAAMENIFHNLIAQKGNLSQFGYYIRANQLQAMPSQGIAQVLQRVSLRYFSQITSSKESLIWLLRKIIRTILPPYFLLFALAAFYSPILIPLVLSPKWSGCVPFFQILCIVAAIYPVNALHINIILATRNTKLFLISEFSKKILFVIIILLTIHSDALVLVCGFTIYSIVCLIINGFVSKIIVKYSGGQQIIDIVPYMSIALIVTVFPAYLCQPHFYQDIFYPISASLALYFASIYLLRNRVFFDLYQNLFKYSHLTPKIEP